MSHDLARHGLTAIIAISVLLLVHHGAQSLLRPLMLLRWDPTAVQPALEALAPFAAAIPAWQSALGVVCAALYLAAAAVLVLRPRTAVALLGGALLLEASDIALNATRPVFAGTFGNEAIVSEVALLAIIAAVGFAGVWAVRKRRSGGA